jgi:hypothetical protein
MDGGDAAYLSIGAAGCISGDGLWHPQGVSVDVRESPGGKADYSRDAAQGGADGTARGTVEALAVGGQLVFVAGLRVAS